MCFIVDARKAEVGVRMLRSLLASNADKQKAKPTHADVRIEPKQAGSQRRPEPARPAAPPENSAKPNPGSLV
jgi:hypothetical protein